MSASATKKKSLLEILEDAGAVRRAGEVHLARVHPLRPGRLSRGPVVYWMSRDQRAEDNWALLYAQHRALELRVPLAVVFCLAPAFLDAPWRAFSFMLEGLAQVAKSLRDRGIPFHLLRGDPGEQVPHFARAHSAGLVVTDFDPLRIKRD